MPEFIRPARAVIITDGDGAGGVIALIAALAAAAVVAGVVVWVLANAWLLTGVAAACAVATVELCAWLYRRHTIMIWRSRLPQPAQQYKRVRALPAPPKAIEATAIIQPNGDFLIPVPRKTTEGR